MKSAHHLLIIGEYGLLGNIECNGRIWKNIVGMMGDMYGDAAVPQILHVDTNFFFFLFGKDIVLYHVGFLLTWVGSWNGKLHNPFIVS